MKKVKQTNSKKQKLTLDKFKVAALDNFSKRVILGGDEPITNDGDNTTTGGVILDNGNSTEFCQGH